MFIELRRAWTPEDMHFPDTSGTCGICGDEAAPSSVIASAATDAADDMGVACPSCIEYLGARNPERSPTIEQYREFLRRFPEPMYASDEELQAATEDFEDPSEVAYEESWLWRLSEKAPW